MTLSNELSVSIGMTNVSYQENESTLAGPNVSEKTSGSISGINGLIHYRFKNETNYSWFSQVNVPLVTGATGSYFSGGGGLEFAFGETGARSVLRDATTSLTVSPVSRYFLAVETNFAYIAYVTETAKKSDTLLEIGGYGGLSKKIGRYHLRAHAGVDRGIGVNTTSLCMKAFIGATVFID